MAGLGCWEADRSKPERKTRKDPTYSPSHRRELSRCCHRSLSWRKESEGAYSLFTAFPMRTLKHSLYFLKVSILPIPNTTNFLQKRRRRTKGPQGPASAQQSRQMLGGGRYGFAIDWTLQMPTPDLPWFPGLTSEHHQEGRCPATRASDPRSPAGAQRGCSRSRTAGHQPLLHPSRFRSLAHSGEPWAGAQLTRVTRGLTVLTAGGGSRGPTAPRARLPLSRGGWRQEDRTRVQTGGDTGGPAAPCPSGTRGREDLPAGPWPSATFRLTPDAGCSVAYWSKNRVSRVGWWLFAWKIQQ